jgi:excisionase family DNA binding protein
MHCQTHFKVDKKFDGRRASCPGCKKEFTITDSSKTMPPLQHKAPAVHLDSSKEFYSTKELAALLGVNPMTIYRMVQRGQIACHQVGRAKRFYRREVEVFLDNCAV